MKTKCKSLKDKKNRSIIHSSTLRIMTITLFLLVLASCSNGDDNVTPATNKVSINVLNPESPASLSFDEKVTITYNYEIVEPNGVRIWIMPYTNGSISPKYSYNSSPLIKGKGSRTVTISITAGDSTVVDQLKIKIASADGSETISESFETVNYTFVAPANQVTISTFNPVFPATLTSGRALGLAYSYMLFDVSSVKLDMDLLNEGKVVLATKTISPLFISGGTSHKGTGGVTFQVTTNSEVKIDQIRIFAKDNANSNIFYESLVDVNYTYTK